MKFLNIVFYFILLRIENILCSINLSAFKNLPPIYNFDDYDKCLKYKTEIGIYCIVYAEIVPNESVPLWLEIEKISADHKRHYRHDHLFFGVCLERCENLAEFPNSKENYMISESVADKEIKAYYTDVYNFNDSSLQDPQNYSNLLNICLNRDFVSKYNLNLRIFVEYCEQNDMEFKWDIWYTLFTTLVAGVLVLVFFSSLYDFILKKRQPIGDQTDEFYKIRFPHTPHALLTSFSICRNYYRLNRGPSSEIEEELKFLDGIRVMCTFLVIMSHVALIFMVLHVQNPDYFEQFYYRPEVSIFTNGTVILHIFFFMSGFLLYVNFKQREIVTPKFGFWACFWKYFKQLFLRFLRLVPSIVLLLLFTTSFLCNSQDGPFWRHITEAERRFCRDYWWKSLLFLNNIADMSENCLHHTWYIATDLQLFGIFLLVVIMISKYEKLKKMIFSILLVFSILVPAFSTYILKLDAFFITNLESYRYLYFKDTPTYYGSYLPFHTNMAGYLFGFISADIYLRLRLKKPSFDYLKLNLLWWLIFPLAFGLLFTGFIFMDNDFEKPSLWEAFYAGVFRNIWSLMMGFFILCLCFKVGWIGYDFLNLNCFRFLARISYQCYLWHTIVIRILMGHFRAPVHVNYLFLFSSFTATLMFTYVVAYFVALLWEYPLAEIMRCLFMKEKVKPTKNQETGEIFVLSDQNISKL